jgi:hypothetical protein
MKAATADPRHHLSILSLQFLLFSSINSSSSFFSRLGSSFALSGVLFLIASFSHPKSSHLSSDSSSSAAFLTLPIAFANTLLIQSSAPFQFQLQVFVVLLQVQHQFQLQY